MHQKACSCGDFDNQQNRQASHDRHRIFTLRIGESFHRGPVYIDAKGSLREDSQGALNSISVNGKLAGVAEGNIAFSATFKSALEPAVQGVLIQTPLSGDQEAPDQVTTPGKGTGLVVVNLQTGSVRGSVNFSDLTSNAVAAHFHQGAVGTAGPVIIPLEGGTGRDGVWHVPIGATLTADQLTALQAGDLYFNIHTENFSGGEIRGQIAISIVGL